MPDNRLLDILAAYGDLLEHKILETISKQGYQTKEQVEQLISTAINTHTEREDS
jgi:DNA-binding winged helix-turn-helix (wHTH) protein